MNGRELLKTGVEWCGVLLLVVVALPVLAIAAFIFRFAAVGLGLVVLAGLILGYCLCPPLRRRANEAGRALVHGGGPSA